MRPSDTVKSWVFWASVAFVVLIVLPLYAAVVVVAVRTNLFDLSGGEFTDEQYKAIWAFLGVALGTAATIMGSILTKSNNDKNLAQQHESEGRQKLDTAVQALALIKSEDKYAPQAVTAGALATLVHLGHPTIAMRATEVAKDDGAVPVATAVWLIDQVLRGVGDDTGPMSRQEAAALLDSMDPSTLTRDSGTFDFPMCAVAAWPSGLNRVASRSLLDSMIGLLVSRDHAWWMDGGTWTWVLYSIDELVRDPTSEEGTRQAAASYGMQLVRVLYAIGDAQVNGVSDSRDAVDIRERLEPVAVDVHNDYWLEHWLALSQWCGAAVAMHASTGDVDGQVDQL